MAGPGHGSIRPYRRLALGLGLAVLAWQGVNLGLGRSGMSISLPASRRASS